MIFKVFSMSPREESIQKELTRLFKSLDRMDFSPAVAEPELSLAFPASESVRSPVRLWKLSALLGWCLSAILAFLLILLANERLAVPLLQRKVSQEPQVHVLPYTKLSPSKQETNKVPFVSVWKPSPPMGAEPSRKIQVKRVTAHSSSSRQEEPAKITPPKRTEADAVATQPALPQVPVKTTPGEGGLVAPPLVHTRGPSR